MAAAPSARSGQPYILTRDQAKEINCRDFRTTITRDLFAVDLNISVEAGHLDDEGKWVGIARQPLPEADVMITDLFSPTFGMFRVTIRYISGHSALDPHERISRYEFFMQTLDIWERLWARGGGEQVEAAMEVLKSTYSMTELMPRDVIKKMFEPQKELTDGSNT